MSAAPKLTPDSAEELAIAGRASLPLIAVVGPTASGKSFLAVALARKLKGEVLACDSTQVYRGFDIGTSKPTPQERRGVPHHLLDLVDPDYPFTAGEYRARAVAVLEDLRQRARLPILTVGTGLYLRALLEGLADAPARSEDLRARLEARANAHGLQYLHRVLQAPRSRSLVADRFSRPPQDDSCHRSLSAHGASTLGGAPGRPNAPQRLPSDQDRSSAPACSAVRPHRAASAHHA